jgi:anthranilate 1,2-dioxygenase small subunit
MVASVDTRIIKQEAADLLGEYVQCLDDERLEEWPGFFVETGVYKIVSRENVERGLPIATMSCTSQGMMKDRVVAIRKASVYSARYLRHIVSNVRVTGADGAAHLVEANYVVFQTLQDQETKVFNVGRYRAKIVLAGGRVKFSELVAVYDSLQIPGLLVIPI